MKKTLWIVMVLLAAICVSVVAEGFTVAQAASPSEQDQTAAWHRTKFYAPYQRAITDTYQFKTDELSKYVIVYDGSNSGYAPLARQLADQIQAKYGKKLTVAADNAYPAGRYEILLGDTNRYEPAGRLMEYSVTVADGTFRINAGGLFSGEKAIDYLCESVFNGQALSLSSQAEHPRTKR